ncbi:MAG: tRNA glutamyl-Q synthetase [Bacteroidetes bacterium]|nr:tRNA glutamyl-Q synthetase [Bacteroidota bacterium]
MPIRSRIAPTPSGYLHIGNAYNFLLTEQLCHHLGGSLRLRIDDLDTARVRQAYLDDIFESLHFLGITWDKGPRNTSEHFAEYTQSLRGDAYNALLAQLVDTGRVFACTCSRAQITASSTDAQYPGTCRDLKLPLDTPNATWRFRTEPEDTVHWVDGFLGPLTLPLFHRNRDFVVRKRDGIAAYQLASLADDSAYGINLIVRGEDLLASTATQLFLARTLAQNSFLLADFYHHPLIKENGEKLSKSAGSTSLKAMHHAGCSGAAIRNDYAQWAASFLHTEQ